MLLRQSHLRHRDAVDRDVQLVASHRLWRQLDCHSHRGLIAQLGVAQRAVVVAIGGDLHHRRGCGRGVDRQRICGRLRRVARLVSHLCRDIHRTLRKLSQVSRRNRYRPSAASHLGFVGLPAHSHRDLLAIFHTRSRAADHQGFIRLGGIDHIVATSQRTGNGNRRRLGVHRDGVVRRRRRVARVVGHLRGDIHRTLRKLGQVSRRNRYRPSAASHLGFVGLPAHRHCDLLTIFHARCCAADHQRFARLALVDNVVTSQRAGDRNRRKVCGYRIPFRVGSSTHVTRCIAGAHARFNDLV